MESMIEHLREGMAVVDSDGVHVGTVDRVGDGYIKLTRSDSHDLGEEGHRYVSLNSVERVDEVAVRLSINAHVSARQGAFPVAELPRAGDKLDKPSTYFDGPHDVVADSRLSDDQKREALETLEQDARQLSEAAAEGMAGGERSNLDEVLDAKTALACAQQNLGPAAERPPHRLARTIQQHPLSSLALAVVAGVGIGMSFRR